MGSGNGIEEMNPRVGERELVGFDLWAIEMEVGLRLGAWGVVSGGEVCSGAAAEEQREASKRRRRV